MNQFECYQDFIDYRISLYETQPVNLTLTRLSNQQNYLISNNDHVNKIKLKSLNQNNGFISGFCKTDLKLIINQNIKDLKLKGEYYEEINNLEINKTDEVLLLTTKNQSEIINLVKNQKLYDLKGIENQSISKFHPNNHNLISIINNKNNLGIYDLRNNYFDDEIFAIFQNNSIKKLQNYKPSDLVWFDDKRILVSSRSFGFIELYDLRYFKNEVLKIQNLLKKKNPIKLKNGIEQMYLDENSKLLYGLNYKSNDIYVFSMEKLLKIWEFDKNNKINEGMITLIPDNYNNILNHWVIKDDLIQSFGFNLPNQVESLLKNKSPTRKLLFELQNFNDQYDLRSFGGKPIYNQIGNWIGLPIWNESLEKSVMMEYFSLI